MTSKMIAGALLALGLLGAPSAAHARECATLYEHIDYKGDKRHIGTGTVKWIGGIWNDQVSSIRVAPGCALNAYEHVNLRGDQKSFSGSIPWVGEGWNDKISSLVCTCH
jgi:hypothetical protein